MAFPDPGMLRMATRSGKLFLSINNITADIRDAVLAEPKALTMPEVWVKLWGVPPKQRRVERLMAATTMIGRPLVVDELSLIRSGPVRMKFACRAPAKLCGSVQIWFNGEGYSIKLEPEVDQPRTAAPALPPPPPPPAGRGPGDQDKDKRKDADQDHDASMEEDDSIDTAAWEKLGITEKGRATTHALQPRMEQSLAGGSSEFDLSIPNQYSSNLGLATSPPVRMEVVVATSMLAEPQEEARTPIVVSAESLPPASTSPAPGGRSNSKLGAVKTLKKVAVRKVCAEARSAAEIFGAPATPRQAVMALAVPVPAPLTQEISQSAPIPKAKRTKAVVEGQVPPLRVSARAKGAKGNLPSL